MTIVLASNSYGKSAVRLLKVRRSGTHHVIREFAVDIAERTAAHPSAFVEQCDGVRRALLETFAHHDSKSVQHTLYAMGEAVLQQCEEVEEISVKMPNRHHLLADLLPMGLDNPNEIVVPTSEPYGLIEATLRRDVTKPARNA